MESKYYITTPVYYVNDVPHIGHAYTSILADIYARYMRLAGLEVYFLTGTDEHGQKVEKAADKAKISPQKFTDRISQAFINLNKVFNISNDDFIRTTEERHINAVKKFWNILYNKGNIYLGKYCGWYAVRDEAFYYESDLIDGKAPTGAEVEWVEEPSYFFALSKWQSQLLDWYENNPDVIKPSFYKNEVINFIKNGLTDLSISRTTFKWGIKVPHDPSHIIYVWLDALVNYVSALGYSNDFASKIDRFWPADIHVVGKDILRFHAIYWPAFLMAVELPLPKTILTHGWWTCEGQKISKSIGNVIDPFMLADEFGVDQVRYFLSREITIGKDGNFSRISFINRINSELCNKIGNLVHRTLSFIYKYNHASIPKLEQETIASLYNSESLLINVTKLSKDIITIINDDSITIVLDRIIEIVDQSNIYIDHQAPWKLKIEDVTKMGEVLYVLTETIRYIAIFLQPFIPLSASKILDLLSITVEDRNFKCLNIDNALKPGTIITKPEPVFIKIEEK